MGKETIDDDISIVRTAPEIREALDRKHAAIWDTATGQSPIRRVNEVKISMVNQDFKVIKLERKYMTQEQKDNALPTGDASRSLDIGIIGVGGAGNHIADEFAAAGYDSMVINLTDRDYNHLAHIPMNEDSRIQLILGAGGAGKNPDVGADAIRQY